MTAFVVLGHLVPSDTCVPFYVTRISAGFPSPADDYAEASLSLDELTNVRASNTYLALATDDSMAGAGISSGDVLIVDRALAASPGDVVFADVDGFTARTLAYQAGRWPLLQSAHPQYPPISFSAGEELKLFGVVTYSLHRLRSAHRAADCTAMPLSLDALANIRAPSTYLVRTAGDSMVGVGIFAGDVLVVSRAIDAQPGDVVIAFVQGEFTVKTLAWQPDCHPLLLPANPQYPPIRFAAGEELKLFGVVTYSLHKQRRG